MVPAAALRAAALVRDPVVRVVLAVEVVTGKARPVVQAPAVLVVRKAQVDLVDRAARKARADPVVPAAAVDSAGDEAAIFTRCSNVCPKQLSLS